MERRQLIAEMAQKRIAQQKHRQKESVKTYKSNCEEIKRRIETKTVNDQLQSKRHWSSFHTNVKRSAQQQQSIRYKETERINSAMCKISSRLDTGMKRAQSAREFTKNEKTENNLRWQ